MYDEKRNVWIDHRNTREYHRRKQLLKTVWIVLGLALLLVPPAIDIICGVFMLFLTISYLDEVPYEPDMLQENLD